MRLASSCWLGSGGCQEGTEAGLSKSEGAPESQRGRGWAGRSLDSDPGTETKGAPGQVLRGEAASAARANLSRGSRLRSGGGRRGVAAQGGPGLQGLPAPKAVARVEALLVRGGGGGLPALLGPAPLLPALPPATRGRVSGGRPWPRPRSAAGRCAGRGQVAR